MLDSLFTYTGFQHTILGMVGGFIGSIGKDNESLTLPCFERTKTCPNRIVLHLGFLGSIIIGGFAGYVIDHSPAVAGLGGYLGLKTVDYAIKKFLPDLVRKPEEEEGVTDDTTTT